MAGCTRHCHVLFHGTTIIITATCFDHEGMLASPGEHVSCILIPRGFQNAHARVPRRRPRPGANHAAIVRSRTADVVVAGSSEQGRGSARVKRRRRRRRRRRSQTRALPAPASPGHGTDTDPHTHSIVRQAPAANLQTFAASLRLSQLAHSPHKLSTVTLLSVSRVHGHAWMVQPVADVDVDTQTPLTPATPRDTRAQCQWQLASKQNVQAAACNANDTDCTSMSYECTKAVTAVWSARSRPRCPLPP